MSFTDWLISDDRYKCILVDVSVRIDDVETTLYLSNTKYEDSGISYNPIINSQSVQISESMNLSGGSGFSIGDIQLYNTDGSIDTYLNHIWVNRSITIRFGDVRWNKVDFKTVFRGLVEDIDSSDRNDLRIRIKDKLRQLESPVTETLIGGTGPNKDLITPLVFGEVFNITPIIVNPPTLQFKFHQGNSERIIDVRDNGVPVGYTNQASIGAFTLTAQNFGQVTCSIQGDKSSVWNNTASKIIQRLVTGFGETSLRFTNDDLDLTNLSNFDTANPQSLGIYITSPDTVLSICQEIASSVGAQLIMSPEGKLQLKKLTITGTPIETINDKDLISNSLSLNQKMPVQGSFKIGYCKNYTVQQGLLTGIPEKHKQLYAKEISEVKTEDSTVKTNYKQLVAPERMDTLLLKSTDATTLSTSLMNLWKTPRFVYSMICVPRLFEIQIGDIVTLNLNRFNLNSKTGQIIEKITDLHSGTISLKVIV